MTETEAWWYSGEGLQAHPIITAGKPDKDKSDDLKIPSPPKEIRPKEPGYTKSIPWPH